MQATGERIAQLERALRVEQRLDARLPSPERTRRIRWLSAQLRALRMQQFATVEAAGDYYANKPFLL